MHLTFFSLNRRKKQNKKRKCYGYQEVFFLSGGFSSRHGGFTGGFSLGLRIFSKRFIRFVLALMTVVLSLCMKTLQPAALKRQLLTMKPVAQSLTWCGSGINGTSCYQGGGFPAMILILGVRQRAWWCVCTQAHTCTHAHNDYMQTSPCNLSLSR